MALHAGCRRGTTTRNDRGGMTMSFRITGLPSEQFTHLFALSDEELALQGAVRRIADSRTPGYPCRVSLTDSREGDELLLVNYEHHPVHSPYRMRFAIYVRKGEETYDAVDQVPKQLRMRKLALRSFDRDAMMPDGQIVGGVVIGAAEDSRHEGLKEVCLQARSDHGIFEFSR